MCFRMSELENVSLSSLYIRLQLFTDRVRWTPDLNTLCSPERSGSAVFLITIWVIIEKKMSFIYILM